MEEMFCFMSWKKLGKQADDLRTSPVYLVIEGEGVKKIPWHWSEAVKTLMGVKRLASWILTAVVPGD